MKLSAGAILVTVSTALAVPAPGFAQEPAPLARPTPPGPLTPPAASTVDVSRLPLDLHRIERLLRQNTETSEFNGLRLQYFVGVFGRAPQIELFIEGEDLKNGPTPWGAPTHRDMLNLWTPKEFSAPPMDFSAFVRWLQQKAK